MSGPGARIGLGAFVVLGVVLNLSEPPGLIAFLPNADRPGVRPRVP